jgi:hypothetical protein
VCVHLPIIVNPFYRVAVIFFITIIIIILYCDNVSSLCVQGCMMIALDDESQIFPIRFVSIELGWWRSTSPFASAWTDQFCFAWPSRSHLWWSLSLSLSFHAFVCLFTVTWVIASLHCDIKIYRQQNAITCTKERKNGTELSLHLPGLASWNTWFSPPICHRRVVVIIKYDVLLYGRGVYVSTELLLSCHTWHCNQMSIYVWCIMWYILFSLFMVVHVALPAGSGEREAVTFKW